MAVSVSPISLILGSFDALFQYNFARFFTLTVPGQFAYYWPVNTALNLVSNEKNKFETAVAPIGVGGGLGARFYPTGKGMTSGFYLEPRVMVNYSQFGAKVQGEDESIDWNQTTLTPKLNLGWDWFSDSGFYSNFGFGFGYGYDVKQEFNAPADIKKYLQTASYFTPIIPNPENKGRFVWDIEFKLGFAW